MSRASIVLGTGYLWLLYLLQLPWLMMRDMLQIAPSILWRVQYMEGAAPVLALAE